uniref:Ig-like domain-containing protein n=1 Tax=Chrysemys picta bellii TaxID=8478 RepID=A0A8C3P8E4_CHRPI
MTLGAVVLLVLGLILAETCYSQTYYPKPSISLRPSRGVALGRAVTLRCRGQHRNMRFLLYKDGNPNALQDVEPAGDVTRFPIRSVSRRDAGSYSCRYSTKSDPPVWSEPSDPVELVVAAGREFLKPTIWVSPSRVVALGGSVTIRCGVRFVLNKEGRHFQPVDSNGFEVVFPISNVSREHGGSYSCSYHSRSEPFGVSYPSDPVELVVRGEGPGSASPGGVALGGAVTIRCRGWYQNVRFLLYKDGNPNAVQYAEPAGDLAEFPISNVSRRDAGSYSCYYHHKWYPFIWSYPSDPVELVVAGEGPGSVSPIPAPHPAGPSGQRHVQGRKQAQAPRISGSGAQNSSGEPDNQTVSPFQRLPPAAGSQQTDPPPTELDGEGEWEKWNNSSPREQGSPLRCPRGHSGPLEGDGPCRQN